METRWNKYYPEWTGEVANKPAGTMYTRLVSVCREYPYRTAYEYFSLKVTYSDFLNQIDAAATMWQMQGVQEGDGVCICMGGCPDVIISIYALNRIGAVISLLVPDSTPDEFADFVCGIDAKFALMSYNQYSNWSGVFGRTKMRKIVIGRYKDYIPAGPSVQYHMSGVAEFDRKCSITGEAPAVSWKTATSEAADHIMSDSYNEPPVSESVDRISVRFESTLNDPDIVAVEATDIAINTASDISSIITKRCEKKKGSPLRVLCLNEYCYVYGFLVGIHNVLLSGHTLLIYTWFDRANIMAPIRMYKPDTLVAFSGTLAKLNAASGSMSAIKNAKFLISAGVPLTLAQKAGLMELMTSLGRHPEIHSFYGNSELFEFLYCMPEMVNEGAVGIPLPDVLVKIVDRNSMFDMPRGKEGEIAVHSPSMCRSFLMRDGSHKNPFRKLSDGRSWLLTEDIGLENEEGVFFRYSNVRGGFKISSATVYPAKVEKVIELVAGVIDVACVVTDTVEGPVLAAAIVPEENYFYDNDAMQRLKARVGDECASMLTEPERPSEIYFFASIPKEPGGRVNYAELGNKVNEIRSLMDEDDIEDEPLETDSES